MITAPAGVVPPILLWVLSTAALQAQFATDWQSKAGGRMAFEVASIKPSTGRIAPSNVSLTPWDDYSVTNGRFIADASLFTYIEFAYKLWPNDVQSREFSGLPQWVSSDRYSIEARAARTNLTKDQIRLMVQSLLADRFQLSAHFATQEVPVFELRLVREGKPGPNLTAHADGPPCDRPGRSPGGGLPGFPADCHSLSAIPRPDTKRILFGSRDVTMDVLAGALSGAVNTGRPVIDQTGLKGMFDFVVEWASEPRAAAADDSPLPSTPDGPTQLEALRDQLGLKLEAAKGSLPVLVIDRVAKPSEN